MPKFEMRHQQDDEDTDPREVVGSKDLRETFDKKERIRGSFSINGIVFDQFEATTPANVCSQINAKSDRTGVTAEIDDRGHLVLVSEAPRDIAVRLGPAYVEQPPSSTGDAAKDVLNTLKHEGEQMRRDGDYNPILEDLGLEASEDSNGEQNEGVRPGFETGASAEERKKAREERAKAPEAAKVDPHGSGIGNAGQPGSAGQGQTRDPTQVPSAPITGGQQQGKLDDGRGRTGDGTGYSARPDGGAAVPGTPANAGPHGEDPSQNSAPKASEPA